MSDEDVPPPWVQMLMDQAREDGYKAGWEDGQKYLWYSLKREAEKVKPYGA